NTDWAAQLVSGLTAGENIPDVQEGMLDNKPRLFGAQADGCYRVDPLNFDIAGQHGAGDAEHAHPLRIPKGIFDILQVRRGFERPDRVAPLDFDGKGHSGARADNALHVGKALDPTAID